MFGAFFQFWLYLSSIIEHFLKIGDKHKVRALLSPFVCYLEIHFVLLINVFLSYIHVWLSQDVVFQDIVIGPISIFVGFVWFVLLDDEHSTILVVRSKSADEQDPVTNPQGSKLDVSTELFPVFNLLAIYSFGFFFSFPQLFFFLFFTQLLLFLLFLLLGLLRNGKKACISCSWESCSDDWNRIWSCSWRDDIWVLFLHYIALGDIFFLDILQLVDVLLDVCSKDHEIIDEVCMGAPDILSITVILNQAVLFFRVVMKYDSALLCL